jgi:formylglycine-generating enzyme required for sulfatase activity
MRTRLPFAAFLAFVACAVLPARAETWRDATTGMEFVRVPGGCYAMGDTFGGGDHNEQPVHEACLSGYWIGRYEVTQGQWRALMAHNPAAYAAGDEHPVDSVNQADIAEFVRRIAARNPGRTFRLPTEAEWEYACRGGGRLEKFGGAPPPAGANTAEYAERHGEGSTPVGSFPPNALGLHDMSGNLWEWVSDVYAADAYLRHDRADPHYQAEGPARLLRGGGWSHDAIFARCSKRHMHCRPTARFDFVGFRLVMEDARAP